MTTAEEPAGRFDRPQAGFAPARTELRRTGPEDAGLDPSPLRRAWQQIQDFTRPQANGHPLYPGAVLCYGHHGRVVFTEATGCAVLYSTGAGSDGTGTRLPPQEQIAASTDTIYDLASVSKLFTSIVIMQLVQAGRLDLDQTMAHYLPEFAAHDKGIITLRMLLTHTSGFPADIPLWQDHPDVASRIEAVLTEPLVTAPGSTYLYSDLNLISLGTLAGRTTGKTLDQLVAEGITAPLEMADTGYNPDPSLRPRIAATEEQVDPPRGVVRGQVHDENAWSLGGVAGHAGVFSTAPDLAILAQTLLNGGSYAGRRILSPDSVGQMINNDNQDFPGHEHGLGFELNQRWYMGGLASIRTAGHTGYTGTSLVIDFDSRSFVILLANRVHPSRTWGSNNPARVAAAQGLAEAMAVRPVTGRAAWFTGPTDPGSSTLTWTPIGVGAHESSDGEPARLCFDVFIDTGSTDTLSLEFSIDGAVWQPLSWELEGRLIGAPYAQSGVRTWQRAAAELPSGTEHLRWIHTSDTVWFGRGVYLDDLRVRTGRAEGAERRPGELVATGGWHLAGR